MWAANVADDRERGAKLFDGMCATCHGIGATGGSAPPLNRPKLERAATDDAFRVILTQGIPERGMTRVGQLNDNEQRQIIAYVRSLGATAPAPVRGDPTKGVEIYRRLGCATCHIINGQGGAAGPELSSIGQQRGSAYLRQSVLDPAATLPLGFSGGSVAAAGFTRYLPVRVVTTQGREVRGYRANEDTFTLQVRELDGALHSFRKADLKQIERLTGTSLMPELVKQLAPAELDDLIAYLARLGTSP